MLGHVYVRLVRVGVHVAAVVLDRVDGASCTLLVSSK